MWSLLPSLHGMRRDVEHGLPAHLPRAERIDGFRDALP
jgi:hypothetical protein